MANVYNILDQPAPLNSRGGALVRWVPAFHGGIASTSQAFGTAGRVFSCQFQLTSPAIIEGLSYVVGGVASGNVILGVYGPISTEETMAAAVVLGQTASTAQGTINLDQYVALTAAVYAPTGRYYATLEGSSTTGTFMRQTNQTQVTGWTQRYDRGGGFGALTDPAPAMTNDGSAMPAIYVRCKASL